MWINSLARILCFLAPWVATSSIFWFSRGEWLAMLGSFLIAASMAALGIDYMSREAIAGDKALELEEDEE